MPYRIPGALDYSDWPVLQILHVVKNGLQFHENCVRVWGRIDRPYSLSVTKDDRRLLTYRFQQTGSSGGQLSDSVAKRVRTLIAVSHQSKKSDIVQPIRAWNADRWYVSADGSPLKIYDNSSGTPAPQEVTDLFHDLSQMRQSSETESELRDVCLGFCYDPLSAMGHLYSNHRCFDNGHGAVCR
jgi:hypothetical protein